MLWTTCKDKNNSDIMESSDDESDKPKKPKFFKGMHTTYYSKL